MKRSQLSRSLFIFGAAVIGATQAHAQIRVERSLNGTTWQFIQDIPEGQAATVNVNANGGSNFPVNSTIYIRIYDLTPGTTLGPIGRLTFQGTPPSGQNGRVKIAIWNNPNLPFPIDPSAALINNLVACTDFGGLSFTTYNAGVPTTNFDLLKKTDLALAMRGNLKGSIDAGRIFTLQVNGDRDANGELIPEMIDGVVQQEQGNESGLVFYPRPLSGNVEALDLGLPQTAKTEEEQSGEPSLWIRAWNEDVHSAGVGMDRDPVRAAIEYIRVDGRFRGVIVAGDSDGRRYVGFGQQSAYISLEEQLAWTVAAAAVQNGAFVSLPSQAASSNVYPDLRTEWGAAAGSFTPITNWSARGSSIRRIVLNGAFPPSGSTRSPKILAPTGRVFSILSQKDIVCDVSAGFGVHQVRIANDGIGDLIVTSGNPNDLVIKSVTANRWFNSNVLGAFADVSGISPLNLQSTVFSGAGGATGVVNLIESDGPITGVQASLITNESPGGTLLGNQLGQSGVISRGKVDTVISDFGVWYANVLGTDLTGVQIGYRVLGAVVATGDVVNVDRSEPPSGNWSRPSAGLISGSSFPAGAVVGPQKTDPFEGKRGIGLIGLDSPPINMMRIPGGSKTPEGYDNLVWYRTPARDSGRPLMSGENPIGAIDSVIRAENEIFKSGVEFMTQVIGWEANGQERASKYRPRLECPFIVTDGPQLPQVEAGVVWSGLLDYDATGALLTTRSSQLNDFFRGAGPRYMGSIGPAGDVWFDPRREIGNALPFNDAGFTLREFPEDFPRVPKREDGSRADYAGLYGELHLPLIGPGQIVRIDEGGIESLARNSEPDSYKFRTYPVQLQAVDERSVRTLRLRVGLTGLVEDEPSIEPVGLIRVYTDGNETIPNNPSPWTASVDQHPGGITGQILLGTPPTGQTRRATAAEYWRGKIVLGNPFNVAQSPFRVIETPDYQLLPSQFSVDDPFDAGGAFCFSGLVVDQGLRNGGAAAVWGFFNILEAGCYPPNQLSWRAAGPDSPASVASINGTRWKQYQQIDVSGNDVGVDYGSVILARTYLPMIDENPDAGECIASGGTFDPPPGLARLFSQNAVRRVQFLADTDWPTSGTADWSFAEDVSNYFQTRVLFDNANTFQNGRAHLSREILVRPADCLPSELNLPTSLPLDGVFRVHVAANPAIFPVSLAAAVRGVTDIPPETIDGEYYMYFRMCNSGLADMGGDGANPAADCVLDNNDFIVFIQFFFENDWRADLGGDGASLGSDGVWDNNDFVVFIQEFFAGQTNESNLTFEVCPSGLAGRGSPQQMSTISGSAGRPVIENTVPSVQTRAGLLQELTALQLALMSLPESSPNRAALQERISQTEQQLEQLSTFSEP